MVSPNQIEPGLPVVCSNNGQFGVVDHIEGSESIKLRKDATGQHHYIPLSWVTRVDDKVHVDRPGDRAMREWSTSPNQSSHNRDAERAEERGSGRGVADKPDCLIPKPHV